MLHKKDLELFPVGNRNSSQEFFAYIFFPFLYSEAMLALGKRKEVLSSPDYGDGT